MEWNLRERDFWNERDPEDLESKSRSSQDPHEIGGRAPPVGRAPCLVGPYRITYRITYDDSWFDSAEKQKLCPHEYNFVKSQERAFALIIFASVQ